MPHESAAAHVTGSALYTDDLVGRFPGLLHAWPVTSPHAHARVTRLDLSQALREPGVVSVLTGADVPGEPWRAEEASPDMWAKLLRGIVGFEMEVLAWRPTIKLSQKKSAEERATIAAGLEASGSPALAELMRTLAK